MKKLRVILSAALLFVMCAVMFVGCGNTDDQKGEPDNTEPTTTMITLAEAKAAIVKTLAEDEDESNRAVVMMQKFGKFTMDCQQSMIDFAEIEVGKAMSFNGTFVYQNYECVNQLMSSDEGEESYLADGVGYTKYKDGTVEKERNDTMEGLTNILEPALTDAAFDLNGTYDDQVQKVTTSEGYSLTLKCDFKGYLYLEMHENYHTYDEFTAMWNERVAVRLAELPADVQADLGMSITAYFNSKHEVTKVVYDRKDFQYYNNTHCIVTNMMVTITKIADDVIIAQPQWVTDYLAANN